MGILFPVIPEPSHLLGPRGSRSAAPSALLREGMVLHMLELGCCVGRNVRFVSSKAGSKREHDFVAGNEGTPLGGDRNQLPSVLQGLFMYLVLRAAG